MWGNGTPWRGYVAKAVVRRETNPPEVAQEDFAGVTDRSMGHVIFTVVFQQHI